MIHIFILDTIFNRVLNLLARNFMRNLFISLNCTYLSVISLSWATFASLLYISLEMSIELNSEDILSVLDKTSSLQSK